MKTLLLPLILGIAGTGGGIGAAMLLSGGSGAPDATAHEEAASTAASTATCIDDAEVDMSGPPAAAPEKDDGVPKDYVRLSNQFVVPVVKDQRVEALIVLSLSVEVPTGVGADIYPLEPKLRDVFLSVLFEHANAGHFGPGFTQDESMTILKRGLRDVARTASGGIISDVLVTEIARQDT